VNAGRERVAIVGMGGVFPDAPTPEVLWRNVVLGRSAARPVDPGRWCLSPEVAVDTEGAVDRVFTAKACLIESDLRPEHLVGARDREAVEPSCDLAMKAGLQAFGACRTGRVARERVAIILGNIVLPTDQASRARARSVHPLLCADPLLGGLVENWGSIGEGASAAEEQRFPAASPAALLKRALGAGGAVFTLDAACASSLVAVKLAVDELLEGRADLVLSGGLSRPDCLYTQMGFTQLRALSRSGVCRPFDARADGLIVGEGAGVVALKRLSDALAHGDRILAVIAGAGVSNDIHGNLLSPASEGQVRAMRAAFEGAGWDPEDVELIECHGTGTKVGDDTEIQSLETLWNGARPKTRSGRCVIGSVKSNVGHLLTAAGGAALVKVLHALAEKTLPPTAGFEVESAALRDSRFEVLCSPRNWESRHPARRAAISGFGFGGINAHLLVEEWIASRESARSSVVVKEVVDEIAVLGMGERLFPMDGMDVPVERFRIPPQELEEMLPQQLVMLCAAADAIDDSGRAAEDCGPRAGTFIGLDLDVLTTQFHLRWRVEEGSARTGSPRERSSLLKDRISKPLTAHRTLGALGGITASRIARAFGFGGSSFTVSSAGESGIDALRLAVHALRRGDLSVALVGAVDCGDDLLSPRVSGTGGRPAAGQGALAVLLKTRKEAHRCGDPILALLPSIDRASEDDADESGLSKSAIQGLAEVLKSVLEARRSRELKGVSGAHECGKVPAGPAPFLFAAEDPSELLHEIGALERSLVAPSADRMRIAAAGFRRGPRSGKVRAALLARDPDELWTGCRVLRQALEQSRSLPGPIAFHGVSRAEGDIAFVFPGWADHAFAGTEELCAAFPRLWSAFDEEQRSVLARAAASRALSKDEELLAQVLFGVAVSDLLQQLGVKPRAMLGCSLGESTALFASGAWPRELLNIERLKASELFTQELLGEHRALRAYWNVAEGQEVSWCAGVINRSREEVERQRTDRVHVLIVNHEQECIVGGDRAQVLRLARELGASLHEIDGFPALHGPMISPVKGRYRDLHDLPTKEVATRLYGAALDASRPISRSAAADAVLRQAMSTVDLPALIDRAWQDGVRVFVEPGPGASLTQNIRRILQGRPHFAVAIARPGCGAAGGLLQALCELFVHGVDVDLTSCFGAWTDGLGSDQRTLRIDLRECSPCVLPHAAPREETRPLAIAASAAAGFSATTRVASQSHGAPWLSNWQAAQEEHARAVCAYEELARKTIAATAQVLAMQQLLLEQSLEAGSPGRPSPASWSPPASAMPARTMPGIDRALASSNEGGGLTREQCLEFARGSVAKVFGESFAAADSFPTRVRLPDEPLMLVDRVIAIEGEERSLKPGRIVTEHDVHAGSWYLDEGHIPTAIAVEAGQADLMLSGYLGIDLVTRGVSRYRLLDAVITFHQGLPAAGATIRYAIAIRSFFRQGDTHLFRFEFDATVEGEPLLKMRAGCAGFFSEAELERGQGLVETALDRGANTTQASLPLDLVPMMEESYDESQLEALRRGDLVACFGRAFQGLALERPRTLPGGRLKLIDRIVTLEPRGGSRGLGRIVGELDVHPQDWFLVCHFVDDPVMPGTLMFECCLHTLRVFLMRMGWIGEEGEVFYEPIPGVASQLQCRGQVTAASSKVQFEVSLLEIGYENAVGVPQVRAQARMFADGRPIVRMNNVSLRMPGTSRARIGALWAGRGRRQEAGTPSTANKAAIFDHGRILEFAAGRPSLAFGERYRVFDQERVIARLPAPPYQFLDRIVAIEGCEAWRLEPGGVIEAEYDVPEDAWYFAQENSGLMPYAVLLEVALQPCGWLAAYLGSALTSVVDLSFRNLGGSGTVYRAVGQGEGTLTTRIKITGCSRSAGMIIEHFDFEVRSRQGLVYQGSTYFGFFSKAALADQKGMQSGGWIPADGSGTSFAYPSTAPFPLPMLAMVERIDRIELGGGPFGLGWLEGSSSVPKDGWFFKAHFHQDPVWPGSLGLEALLQILKVSVERRFSGGREGRFATMIGAGGHRWTYRGQILKSDSRVAMQCHLKSVDQDLRQVTADGWLKIDGRLIYHAESLAVRWMDRQ